jgi:hypothetical protein
MADRVEQVTRQETVPEATTTGAVRQTTVVHPGPGTVAARIIWWVAGVLLVLLAFRFVLALLGANPGNGFANFIYSVSHPFVAPFFGLFSYNTQLGVSRFEIYTLVAMAVYAVIAWGLARLVTLNRPHAAY